MSNREIIVEQLVDLSEEIDRATVRLYMEQAAGSIPAVINGLQGANIEPISITLFAAADRPHHLHVAGHAGNIR